MTVEAQSGTEQNANPNASQDGGDPKAGGTGQADPKDGGGTSGEGGGTEGESWFSKLDPKGQKYIKDLRAEAAQNRTQAKNLGEQLTTSQEQMKKVMGALGIETDDPKAQVEELSSTVEQVSTRNAILEMALGAGIPADGLDYFTFLVGQKLESLEEGQEFDEPELLQVSQEVFAKMGGKKGSGKTSVGTGDTGDGGDPPNPDGSGEPTIDEFNAMNMSEKSELYSKSPDLYNKLFKAAKANRSLTV